MAEFVYQMYKARKAHNDKVILDDVRQGRPCDNTAHEYPTPNA